MIQLCKRCKKYAVTARNSVLFSEQITKKLPRVTVPTSIFTSSHYDYFLPPRWFQVLVKMREKLLLFRLHRSVPLLQTIAKTQKLVKTVKTWSRENVIRCLRFLQTTCQPRPLPHLWGKVIQQGLSIIRIISMHLGRNCCFWSKYNCLGYQPHTHANIWINSPNRIIFLHFCMMIY